MSSFFRISRGARPGFTIVKMNSLHAPARATPRRGFTLIELLPDADQVAVTSTANTWRAQLPEKPVHGSVRNYVYFDGHVAPAKVNPKGGF